MILFNMFVLFIVEVKPHGSDTPINATNTLFSLGKSRGKGKGKGMGFARAACFRGWLKPRKKVRMGIRVKTRESV